MEDEKVEGEPIEGEEIQEGTWFDFFRAGVWNGEELGEEFMLQLLNNFDPLKRKCKLFISHNSCFESGKPSLGEVDGLRIEDGYLQARAVKVHAQLKEAVNSGMYPDRSLEAYHFPEEGGWTLTGIAFLGAEPPAVSGLRYFHFSAEKTSGGERRILRLSANGLTKQEEKGGEEMDQKQLQKMIEEASEKAASTAIAQFKSSDEFKALEAKATKADELEGEVTSLKSEGAERKLAQKRDGIRQFVAQLLEQKKVTPAVVEELGLEDALFSLDAEAPIKCAGKDVSQLDAAKRIVASLLDASKLFESSDDSPSKCPHCGKSIGGGKDKDEDTAKDKDLEAANDVKKPLEFSIVDNAFKR